VRQHFVIRRAVVAQRVVAVIVAERLRQHTIKTLFSRIAELVDPDCQPGAAFYCAPNPPTVIFSWLWQIGLARALR
jgi:hypothetical protein